MSSATKRKRKAKKSCNLKSTSRISTMILVASIRNASGFSILRSDRNALFQLKQSQLQHSFLSRHRQRLSPLNYADGDDKNNLLSDNEGGSSSSASHKTFVSDTPDNDVGERKLNEAKVNPLQASKPTDISDAIKEVLNAPVIPSEEETRQELILPINNGPKTQSLGPSEVTSAVPESKKTVPSQPDSRSLFGGFDLERRWRRLRPGQKFRIRLGLASIAFVSLWNTIIARNYSGFITGIITGAAATTTATGFGSILRRWLSSRGFQGIAALGRSIAYGWAIFVAYPRMLDRRAKERRMKREEEALKQWRSYLKAIAAEVNRLKKELSLLDGEIRTFRREILAIRAARFENTQANSKADDRGDTDGSNANTGDSQSDRVLREAILSEMAHLTRLRDDTRLALTTARKRWSEVRLKRPISHSKSSAFDALEFELDIAADFESGGITIDNSSDDPLLTGF